MQHPPTHPQSTPQGWRLTAWRWSGARWGPRFTWATSCASGASPSRRPRAGPCCRVCYATMLLCYAVLCCVVVVWAKGARGRATGYLMLCCLVLCCVVIVETPPRGAVLPGMLLCCLVLCCGCLGGGALGSVRSPVPSSVLVCMLVSSPPPTLTHHHHTPTPTYIHTYRRPPRDAAAQGVRHARGRGPLAGSAGACVHTLVFVVCVCGCVGGCVGVGRCGLPL